MKSFHILLAGLAFAAAATPAQAQTSDVDKGANAAKACGLDHDPDEAEFRAFAPAKRQAVMACFQRQSALDMQPQLPQKVDGITTLRGVTAVGTQIRYDYVVDLDATAVTAEQRQSIEQNIRTKVCGSKDMAAVIRNGGSYAYRWEGRGAVLIHRMTVAAC